MKKKKKKLVGYELVQAIQASIQKKVTGKRGTRVTAGGITCSNVARNGDSKQEESARSDGNNNIRRLQRWRPVRERAVNALLVTLQ
jgi:hypothetical protein